MGMSRLISQLFFGVFFSWKYHTQASTMSSFSGCAKSTQTSQPTHTSCHSYTASHRAHQHTDGSVTILCWSFSLFLSLLQTIHHTGFVSQDCFCLLLSASYCYIHFCWDWIASFSVFFKRILCTCKFWMLACVIWLWLLFKMFPKWGTCDP